jgi:hypothetical protein
MNKILILLMIVVLFVMVAGCSGSVKENAGGDGNTGNTVNDSDSGNTGNTDDTGDSGATCTGSDKFCHSHDGLNWSDASSYSMYWDDAVDYCEDLGGRLPTISEIRTLIKNCPATVTGGDCGVTNDCLSSSCWNKDACWVCSGALGGRYSKLGDTGWYWSSSELSDVTDYAWGVYFASGSVYYSSKGYENNVRCVK